MTNEQWGQVQSGLRKTLGKSNYSNWIEPLEYVDVDGGVAHFLVPTNFLGNWVERNFADKILAQMKGEGIKVSRLDFTVPSKPSKPRSAGRTASKGTVPRAESHVLDEAMGAAQKIAEKSMITVMAIKEAVHRADEVPLSEGILFERRMFHALFATEDQKEGMRAFAEKREPQFRDK